MLYYQDRRRSDSIHLRSAIKALLHALHKELVDSGKMTNRNFHDAILKENRMPIEMMRAILTKQKLTRDFKSSWKFYGPVVAL